MERGEKEERERERDIEKRKRRELRTRQLFTSQSRDNALTSVLPVFQGDPHDGLGLRAGIIGALSNRTQTTDLIQVQVKMHTYLISGRSHLRFGCAIWMSLLL
jgi:hypothetical protein